MSATKEELINKLNSQTACIGIIGLGYVGLPLTLTYSNAGFNVIGFDIDDTKVHILNHGESYIERISATKITQAREHGFSATSDFSKTSECDALIICVPTPLTQYREPDISFIINTVNSIKPYLRSGQIVSLESTTYPGTTEEELLPRIEEVGLKIGEDIFLVYSPEREDPGNVQYSTCTIPKVVGGHTAVCLEVGKALYKSAINKVVPVGSTKVAEMTKLLENIHRAVNIGLVNEMKTVADRMGIDIFEVIDAAATKPFGFTPYYPGPGLGGHCIPIDPYYLTWKARQYGVNTRFIELSGEVNRAMPEYVVRKLIDGLNQQRKPISGSKILILGISYKKNVDDMRESPAVEIMRLIENYGGQIFYSDPHVPSFPKIRKVSYNLNSTPITKENLTSFDAVILATNHDQFDYSFIGAHANLIIDSRGVYRAPNDKVIHA